MTNYTTNKILKVLLIKGDKTVEDIAKQGFEYCKKHGYKLNKQGRVISIEGLERLCRAMLRDIKNSKGKWHSQFKIVDTKNDTIKLEKKEGAKK